MSGPDRGSIGSRVGNDEEHAIEAAISDLPCQAPELLLDVDKPRFELHATGSRCSVSDREVPGAQVSVVADRHLRTDAEIGPEEGSKGFRQA